MTRAESLTDAVRSTTVHEPPSFQSVTGRSPYDPFANSAVMRALKREIAGAAATDAAVLFVGERGVGKELAARTLHHESPRRHHAFIRVNCAGLPMDLQDKELFGPVGGAFTGGHRRKPGKLELANGGTIFLDEIGEMPLPLQAKLVLGLRDRTFSRLDSPDDVRVIATTNRDLAHLVDQGLFREDLYHRLNAVALVVPPLRERREEIPIMLEHFADRYTRQYLRPRLAILPATIELFHLYPWPGNIRELKNTVKRIVALGTQDWLVHKLRPPHTPTRPAPLPAPTTDDFRTAPALADDGPSLTAISRAAALQAERGVLKQVLDRVRWNRRAAAQVLKVSYRTLRRKIAQCGLDD